MRVRFAIVRSVEPELPAKHARLLYELGSAFAAQLDIDRLVPSIMERCREALDAEGAAVLLLDEASGELFFPYVSERDPEVSERLRRVRFPADRGIAGAVLTSGVGQLIANAATDPRFYGGVDRSTGVTTRDMIAAPLAARRGTIGVIEVINHRTATFVRADLALLEALAGSVAVAIENARMFSALRAREEKLRSEVGLLRRDLARRDGFTEIIGSSAAIVEVLHLMESAAASPISVLIEGETGTGKELVARGIHGASSRGQAPFVAVNCGALPADLLESELFGHRKGSFTGATTDHRGLFEAADGGTILLDEVGDLPLSMQVKLLRVLQDGEITPIGTTRPHRVDVRVISATNRPLRSALATGEFRDDLFYRLSAFPIHVPPLRERPEDLPLLCDHFLVRSAERHGKRIAGISPAAFEAISRYSWPGNVRELQNEMDRAVALAGTEAAIELSTLSIQVRSTSGAAGAVASRVESGSGAQTIADTDGQWRPLKDARAAFEAGYIAGCLRAHGGNVSRTAEILGLSRVMLHRKLKEYGIR
jgi:Nif-specific regulatory protein